MSCYLCGDKSYIEILNKRDICIWTNASDEKIDKKRKQKCVLSQCINCGHVYQPISEDFRNILNEIYLSDSAQASTPLGKGNWGLERARRFLDILDKVDLCNYKSAIEIGCADGYLLRYLKNKGFKNLTGIDPSIDKSKEIDGVLFLKDFANEKLKFSQKYDLIFSKETFEHVENINGLIKFCKKNLIENGKLFFSVPNAQAQLENGDPGLFIHQHVHYFTEGSLTYLLSKMEFEIEFLVSTKESLVICAKNKMDNNEFFSGITFFRHYQKETEEVLIKVKSILQKNNVIVHGANSALNNILGWLDKDFEFVLIDNDNLKQKKKYFNKIVRSIKDVELRDYSTILIIPTAFYETIKYQYINSGFKGKIENIF